MVVSAIWSYIRLSSLETHGELGVAPISEPPHICVIVKPLTQEDPGLSGRGTV